MYLDAWPDEQLGVSVAPTYKRYTGGMVNMRAPLRPNGMASRMKDTADRMILQRTSVASRPQNILKRAAVPLSALVCPPGHTKLYEGTPRQRCVKTYVPPTPLALKKPKATPCPTGSRWSSARNRCEPIPGHPGTGTVKFAPRILTTYVPRPVPTTRPPLLPQPVAVGPVASPAPSPVVPVPPSAVPAPSPFEPKAGGPQLDQPTWVDVLLSKFTTPSVAPVAAAPRSVVSRPSSIGPSQTAVPTTGMDVGKLLMFGLPIGAALFFMARK